MCVDNENSIKISYFKVFIKVYVNEKIVNAVSKHSAN